MPNRASGTDFTWLVPGSKSITNRALVLAALTEQATTLTAPLDSDDTRHMRNGLRALGVAVDDADDARWQIHGGRSRLQPATEECFIGNSGTTVRFLAALASTLPGATTLVGDEDMARRPIADLTEALTRLGVATDCPSGCPPLTVHGGTWSADTVPLRCDRSSQYLSGLLMASSAMPDGLTVTIEGELVSRPYVDMTMAMIRAFGGDGSATTDRFRVEPARLEGRTYAIEPDASSASYAFAAAAVTGATVRVPHLGTESLQGDVGLLDILEQMGCQVTRAADSCAITGPDQLRGVDVDMFHISDTVMTLAAIAPLADGPTTIRNIANIRIKETDRLHALVTELERLGIRTEHGDDWLRIHPGDTRAARIDCYRDHRIAMAFSILGLVRPEVTIDDPDCVAKTYPGFFEDLAAFSAAAGTPWTA